MKRDLLDILACPICKSNPLILEVKEEDHRGIREGKLTCPKCKTDYPITEGIPNMIPPEKR